MTISARRLLKQRIPNARPSATPMGTAMMIEESVTIALSHWPKTAR